jgi:uncharacterized protein YggT (Ycf19 family)
LIVLDQLRLIFEDIANGTNFSVTLVLALIVRQLILDIIIVFLVIIILRIVVSLFNADPWHPLVRVLREVSTPLVRPFAGLVPRSRTVDIAAIVAAVVYFVVYLIARRVLDELVIHSI